MGGGGRPPEEAPPRAALPFLQSSPDCCSRCRGSIHSPRMFCPKCAAELTRQNGALKCVAGDMELSPYLERALIARYGEHVLPNTTPLPSQSLGQWFCPGCRESLSAGMVCQRCQV